ncbi:MAG: TauD/TfdA family dioxygenase [Halofilum sp. (in: g-proteobacteria)]|nr:TauD/TfdA family dioxygenase [Halofilum sp. (in: g-proteobacteria)]
MNAPIRPIVDMGELSNYAGTSLLAHAELAGDELTVTWDDGASGRFHLLWLRDHCACGECRHPQTRERLFRLIDLPETLPAPHAEVTSAGALRLSWPPMGEFGAHESLFDPGWLRQRATPEAIDALDGGARTFWDASLAGHVPSVRHAEFMDSDAGAVDWLHALDSHGLVLLRDGPLADQEVLRVAERIGWPRETNFGRHFDVVSKPDPNNAAFTAGPLEPHVDLPNWQRAPDFQLLYCLANEAQGGDSLLTDGFAVAEALRREDPEAFEVLATQRVDFRFQDETTDIGCRAPVIGRDADGNLTEIRFNNWIRDSLRIPAAQVAPFYRAYRRFWQLLRDPRYLLRLRLEPGQMIAFDNLRVLHGREAFDPNTGFRRLQGAYLDRDPIRSRLRVLGRQAA